VATKARRSKAKINSRHQGLENLNLIRGPVCGAWHFPRIDLPQHGQIDTLISATTGIGASDVLML
jgi:hypothetical protein